MYHVRGANRKTDISPQIYRKGGCDRIRPIFLSATANKLAESRSLLQLKYDICIRTRRFSESSRTSTRIRHEFAGERTLSKCTASNFPWKTSRLNLCVRNVERSEEKCFINSL